MSFKNENKNARRAAEVDALTEDESMYVYDVEEVEIDEEDVSALLVGDSRRGAIFLTIHSCPFCHNEMQTIGIAHGIYECSKCASVRGRRITLERTFKSLEVEE